jgi:hypothetical protein
MSREPDCPACGETYKIGQDCQQQPWEAFRDYLPIYCSKQNGAHSMKMLIDKETFARQVAADADLDCEARPVSQRLLLAETIRRKLLGVAPEDQDAVLEDSDWRIILAALSRS